MLLQPFPGLGMNAVTSTIPQINIHKLDSNASNGGGVGGGGGGGGMPLPIVNRRQFEGSGLHQESVNVEDGGAKEMIKDPNLDRYLKQGRRHTLAATQHTALINLNAMKR